MFIWFQTQHFSLKKGKRRFPVLPSTHVVQMPIIQLNYIISKSLRHIRSHHCIQFWLECPSTWVCSIWFVPRLFVHMALFGQIQPIGVLYWQYEFRILDGSWNLPSLVQVIQVRSLNGYVSLSVRPNLAGPIESWHDSFRNQLISLLACI